MEKEKLKTYEVLIGIFANYGKKTFDRVKDEEKLHHAVYSLYKNNTDELTEMDFRKRSEMISSSDINISLLNLGFSKCIINDYKAGTIELADRLFDRYNSEIKPKLISMSLLEQFVEAGKAI